MWEGGGGQDGVEWGGGWDNCNSIINKYIKKKERIIMCCDRDANYHYNGNHITIYTY